MTKLILHGGGDPAESKLKIMIREIEKDIPKDKSIKILIAPFARAKEEWKGVFDRYSKRYVGISAKKIFILASPHSRELKNQVKISDVIFFPGGSERLLKKYIKYIDFSLFKNKTIVGVSAGANIFSSSYYSNDRGAVEKGFYKLPIKTICHFNDLKKNQLKKLILGREKSKKITLAIGEGDFFVLFF
ncbi:MAG: Type 1 glutamine amidotransferase-like domain-containing protein [Patescibacteria group bacterium]